MARDEVYNGPPPGVCGGLEDVVLGRGLDLAPRLGLPSELLVKGGNWLGPLLVAAAEAGVARLLLFGYQGKLIKLAGGIFHTHHHLADGRAEVLTALAALEGLPGEPLSALHKALAVVQAPPWPRYPSYPPRDKSRVAMRWSRFECNNK